MCVVHVVVEDQPSRPTPWVVLVIGLDGRVRRDMYRLSVALLNCHSPFGRHLRRVLETSLIKDGIVYLVARTFLHRRGMLEP